MQANKTCCVLHGFQDLSLLWLKDLHWETSASGITKAQTTAAKHAKYSEYL